MFWKRKPTEEPAQPPRIANAFYVLDRELERMHTLLLHYKNHENNAPAMWKRILELQDVTMRCAKESDEKLQERIAEFALLGKAKTRQASNLYHVVNEELARMHNLLEAEYRVNYDQYNSQYRMMGGPTGYPIDRSPIYQHIRELHHTLMEALKSHDALIQQKVAELALTDGE